ncbi:LacI family DNA-binding transcriptional regulator [Rugosimonospora africana]|uniref:LacI family DNA-binding transcriptional regulator n=1 Tax=Rugosimonospora africana TaxID=556532 RepID=UPI001EF24693|nr:LacI family DNA-binding transcriptional regulator [Rugosimonospora africana]
MTGRATTGSRKNAGSASISDVAGSAGVSLMTVSRVINGHPRVSEETRRRVLAAIRKLNYRPIRAARDLSRGRSRSVTVMTSNTTLYGRAALLQGIEEAARYAGLHTDIGILESPRPSAVEAAIERSCDPASGGVIVIAFDLAGVRALRAIPAGIPVAAAVEINNVKDSRAYPTAALDDRAAAFAATQHLLDLGHRTVHHVSIPSSTNASARLQGWRAALREARARIPEVIAGGWTPQSGYEAGQRLAADRQVTAVLCGNDDLALGVIHALRQAGRAVPDSVSVVGFDDVPSAAFYAPPLTTVRLDFVGLGHDCFALLQHAADPDSIMPEFNAAAPKLVVRETTRPPRRP